MALPAQPLLYKINTRLWVTELSKSLGRPATLDDIPDAELDRLAEMGFDWIWFLRVWQTGPAAQQVSRRNPEWRKEFQETLPDLGEEDIAGSPRHKADNHSRERLQVANDRAGANGQRRLFVGDGQCAGRFIG